MAAGSALAAASELAESTRMGEPFDTLSPTLIFSSLTTPALGDGIAMGTLSDSSVMSDCSLVTASPGLTRTSMTSTSLKSPMSGTGMVVELPSPPVGRACGGLASCLGSGFASFLGSGFCSAFACCLGASSFASSSRIGEPFDTLSPILILSSFTTPALGDGISIVALSDSSVISDCSLLTASPGLTSTSMTATSLKSPISGTTTWVISRLSYHRGIGLLGIDAVLLERLRHLLGLHFALIGERLQRGDGDEVAVHLEEIAQPRARIGAPEAIGAEYLVRAPLRDERPDLLGEGLDVVARGDDRTRLLLQRLGHVSRTRLRLGVEQVPALGGKAVAAQLGEAGGAPYVCGDAPVALEKLRGRLHFAQDGAAAEELHSEFGLRFALPKQIQAFQNTLFGALRHGRMLVVLVHQGDVIEDILLVGHHAPQAVVDDDRDLVTVGRIVRDAVRDHRGKDMGVPVLVLQALAVQGRAPCGGAEQEAARALVARGPGEVADALHAEHRIEGVERHGDLVGVTVRSRGGEPGGEGAGLVDALFEDLALLVLAVVHHLVAVGRLVLLALGGEDAELAEHAFHAEGARLVRHDRHDALANLLIPH